MKKTKTLQENFIFNGIQTMKMHITLRWNALLTASVFAVAFLSGSHRVQAQANPNPPTLMTYQGYLVDGNGVALATNAPKNYDVIFRIWDSPTATAAGNKLWAEQQTVTVDKGYFSVLLGEGSNIGEPRPLLNTIFTNATASDRWVGITVKGIGGGGADVDILPRLRLLASPYAYLAHKAINVDGAAVLSGTIGDARLSTNVALRAGGNTFSGTQTINGGLSAANANGSFGFYGFSGTGTVLLAGLKGNNSYGPQFRFEGPGSTFVDIGENSTGDFVIEQSDSTKLIVTTTGNVGIGTTTPGFPLNFANVLGDKISLWGNSGNSYGFGIQGGLLQIHSDSSGGDIAFGYGSSASMTERMRIKGNGNVGIGTSSPGATLDVNGNLIVSGGITTGSGANAMPGATPLIVEEKSPNNQTSWTSHEIDLSPWANRPGGFKIRIYAQHELAASDYEVRNYEATCVFEQPGYANNPQFPSQVYRISLSWTGNQGRHSLKLGLPAISSGGGAQEAYPDSWVKICNYLPNSTTGGTSGGYSYYTGLNKYVVVVFHPHVSGRIVISDN
jgi:hypothetical protein